MKKYIPLTIILAVVCIAAGLFLTANMQKESKDVKFLVVFTPERPLGQQDAIGLTCPPIETVRIGFIGLGSRGSEAIRRFTYQKGIEIKALCDLHQSKVDSCQQMLHQADMPEATEYYGSEDAWKQMCERPSFLPMNIYAGKRDYTVLTTPDRKSVV